MPNSDNDATNAIPLSLGQFILKVIQEDPSTFDQGKFDFGRALNGVEALPDISNLVQSASEQQFSVDEENPVKRMIANFKLRLEYLLEQVFPLIFDSSGHFLPGFTDVINHFSHMESYHSHFFNADESPKEPDVEFKMIFLQGVLSTIKWNEAENTILTQMSFVAPILGRLTCERGSFRDFTLSWDNTEFTKESIKIKIFNLLHAKSEEIEDYVKTLFVSRVEANLITAEGDPDLSHRLLVAYNLSKEEIAALREETNINTTSSQTVSNDNQIQEDDVAVNVDETSALISKKPEPMSKKKAALVSAGTAASAELASFLGSMVAAGATHATAISFAAKAVTALAVLILGAAHVKKDKERSDIEVGIGSALVVIGAASLLGVIISACRQYKQRNHMEIRGAFLANASTHTLQSNLENSV